MKYFYLCALALLLSLPANRLAAQEFIIDSHIHAGHDQQWVD